MSEQTPYPGQPQDPQPYPGQPYQDQPQDPQPYPGQPGFPPQGGIPTPEDGKVMAILAYIIFFIPMITGDFNKNPFVRFHTNQGLVLALTGIASSLATIILAFIPIIGWIIIILLPIAILVLVILGIVNAANLQIKPLPLIGGITLIK